MSLAFPFLRSDLVPTINLLPTYQLVMIVQLLVQRTGVPVPDMIFKFIPLK